MKADFVENLMYLNAVASVESLPNLLDWFLVIDWIWAKLYEDRLSVSKSVMTVKYQSPCLGSVGEIKVLGLLKQFLECGNKPFEESKVKDHVKADFVENLMYLNERI